MCYSFIIELRLDVDIKAEGAFVKTGFTSYEPTPGIKSILTTGGKPIDIFLGFILDGTKYEAGPG